MALDPTRNFALVEVSGSFLVGASTITLVSGGAAKLPVPATDGAFNIVLWNKTDFPNPANAGASDVEIVRVTSITGEVLTITRAQESTTAIASTAGKTYKMLLSPTKKTIDDIDDNPLTTKGDIPAFSTAKVRLAVGGVDGQVLTVDSGEATGLKYAAVFAGGGTIGGDTFISNGFGLVIGHDSQITAGNTSELQVLGTGGSDSTVLIGRFKAGSQPPNLHFLKSRNATIGSNTIVNDNDSLGEISWYPDDGVDFATRAARFKVEVDDASPAVGDIGAAFLWQQMAGGGAALAETMRLDAAGNLTLHTGSSIYLKEKADATADVVAYGQLWVDDTTPNVLMFTDDAGTDFNISGGGGGFSWGDSDSGTSGTGLGLTVSNSSAAATKGLSITLGSTQSNDVYALYVDISPTWNGYTQGILVVGNGNNGTDGHGHHLTLWSNFDDSTHVPFMIGDGTTFNRSLYIGATGLIDILPTGAFNASNYQAIHIAAANITRGCLWVDGSQTAMTDGYAFQLWSQTINQSEIGNRTTEWHRFSLSRTDSRTSGTTADDFDMFRIDRASRATGSGGTVTAAGSVLKVYNTAYGADAGTLTDSVVCVEIAQDDDSSGSGMSITCGGTKNAHISLLGDPAKAAPADGDLWYTGSALNFYDGSSTTDLLVGGGGAKQVEVHSAFCANSLGTTGNMYTHTNMAATLGGWGKSVTTSEAYISLEVAAVGSSNTELDPFDRNPEIHCVFTTPNNYQDKAEANKFMIYFGLDQVDTDDTAIEKHFGLLFDNAGVGNLDEFGASNANGTTQTVTADITVSGVGDGELVTASAIMDGTTDIKFYINKTLIATHTTNLPTGALDTTNANWFTIRESGGGVMNTNFTVTSLSVKLDVT